MAAKTTGVTQQSKFIGYSVWKVKKPIQQSKRMFFFVVIFDGFFSLSAKRITKCQVLYLRNYSLYFTSVWDLWWTEDLEKKVHWLN